MTSNFKFVRDELVKKIGGLPLLAKVLGAAVQLSSDHEQWVTNLKSILIYNLQTLKVSLLKRKVFYGQILDEWSV